MDVVAPGLLGSSRDFERRYPAQDVGALSVAALLELVFPRRPAISCDRRGPVMSLEDRVADQVRALEALDLERLRAEWRRLYGPPLKLRSPDLLRRLLAWRIQADQLGGLSPAVLAALKAKPSTKSKTRLSEGVRISREWQGRRYDVQATDDGYLFNGKAHQAWPRRCISSGLSIKPVGKSGSSKTPSSLEQTPYGSVAAEAVASELVSQAQDQQRRSEGVGRR